MPKIITESVPVLDDATKVEIMYEARTPISEIAAGVLIESVEVADTDDLTEKFFEVGDNTSNFNLGGGGSTPTSPFHSTSVEDADTENVVFTPTSGMLAIGANSQAAELPHYTITVNGDATEPRSISFVGGDIIIESYYGLIAGDVVTVSYDGLGTTEKSDGGAAVPIPAFNESVAINVTVTGAQYSDMLTYAGATYDKIIFINFVANIANINNLLGFHITDSASTPNIDATGLSAHDAQLQLNLTNAMTDGVSYTVSYDGKGALEDANGISLRPFNDTITYTA